MSSFHHCHHLNYSEKGIHQRWQKKVEKEQNWCKKWKIKNSECNFLIRVHCCHLHAKLLLMRDFSPFVGTYLNKQGAYHLSFPNILLVKVSLNLYECLYSIIIMMNIFILKEFHQTTIIIFMSYKNNTISRKSLSIVITASVCFHIFIYT